MTMLKSRAARAGIALAGTLALFGATAAPAMAATPEAHSHAYGVSAQVKLGRLTVVNVPPTPTSTYQPGADNSVADVNLGVLGSVGLIHAITSGDFNNGSSTATARIASVKLLLAAAGIPAISADAIEATCAWNAPAAPTGSTTVANLKLAGHPLLNLTLGTNDPLTINLAVAKVTINEQTISADNVFSVNAVHIEVPANGSLVDIVIGHADCGPNSPPFDAFSFANTPIILGGIAVLLALVFGIRAGIRRSHAQA